LLFVYTDTMAKLERKRKFIRSFEAKALKSRSRSFMTQLATDLTMYSGSPLFLFLNIFIFVFWLTVNSGFIPGIVPFDPYPFGLLTMVVSLEAIMLSIFVLVAQNRSARISTIRDEVQMQVNFIAEEEITKVLEVLAEIRKKLEITRRDPLLDKMIEQTDTSYIERTIVDQLERANKPLWAQLIKEFPDLLRKNENNGSTAPTENKIEPKPALVPAKAPN
jgi:uncharacterized membrane protein